MFGKKKGEDDSTINIKKLEKENKELEAKVEKLEKENTALDEKFGFLKREHEIDLKEKTSEASLEEKKKNNELKEENAVLKKQVEILEQAFENMGFDVKDMKDILNKLVDAVVSKNEIKLVK